MKTEKRMATSKEVARYIGSSEAYLRAQRYAVKRNPKADVAPFYKLGRRVVYNLDEVDIWLNHHRVKNEGGLYI